eukprot:58582-Ditylum_brightwellii.AAC.1
MRHKATLSRQFTMQKKISLLYQKDNNTLEQYMESFLKNTNAIKHSAGNIGEHPKLAQNVRKLEGEEDSVDRAVVNCSLKQATEAYYAYAFISGVNWKKYTKLLEDLSNAYLHGKDKYPKTLVAAHKLITNWEIRAVSHTTSANVFLC